VRATVKEEIKEKAKIAEGVGGYINMQTIEARLIAIFENARPLITCLIMLIILQCED